MAKNVFYLTGMCCGCEEEVPIYYSEKAARKTAEHREIGYIGDEGMFVCIPHTFYAERCDGSGQIPQTLVKEK